MTRKKFLNGILAWLAKVPSKGDRASVDFGKTKPMDFHGWGTSEHNPTNLRARGRYHAEKGTYTVEIVEADNPENVVIKETTVPSQGGLPPTKEQTLETLVKKIESLINKGDDSDDEDEGEGNKGSRSGSSEKGGTNSTMALVRAECRRPSLSPWKRFKSFFRRLSSPDLGARVLDTARFLAPFVIGGVVVVVIVAAGVYAGPTIYRFLVNAPGLRLGQLSATTKVAKTVANVLVATPTAAKTVAGVLTTTPTVAAALPPARAALRHVVKYGVSAFM